MSINLFDVNVYRAANPDLGKAGITTDAQLSQHFQSFGINEGRQFSLFADLNFYRSSNPDLAAAGVNTNRQLLDHLQNFGVQEGRRFSTFFDTNFYIAANPDVAKAFNNNREQALTHLQTYGLNEGRQFSQFFNVDYYKANNSDLAAAGFNTNQQLLQHFEIFGVNETRLFSVPFDTRYYRNTYADLKNLDNRQLFNHFEQFGLNEGRASSQYFNVSYYLTNNSDLRSLNYNNSQAYNHFVLYGLPEGRFGSADGYNGTLTDTRKGSGTRSIRSTPSNPSNYEEFGGVGDSTKIQFAKGQTRQTLNLSIIDDGIASGDKTVIWQVDSSAPFGFSQATYQFNERNTEVPIELSLGSNIKTATIIIKDSEVLHTFAATNTPVSIPDNASNPLISNLSVSGFSGVLKDVNVKLNISTQRDSDLQAVLISPKGTKVKLFSNVSDNGANFTDTVFDDQFSIEILSGKAPFTGKFFPQDRLSSFNGENPNGTWKLQIADNVSGVSGILNSWSLELTN